MNQNPSLGFSKTADKSTVSQAGEVVVYTLTVTNTGNVTIKDVRIVDARVNVDQLVGTLVPGQSATISATYVVTQADMDAGSFVNVATVSGTDPNGKEVEETDSVAVTTNADAKVTVTKVVDKSTYSEIGEVLTYTINVRNSGTLTLKNISVLDPLTRMEINIESLSPGEVRTFTTTYVIKLEDLQAGTVKNTVFVKATDPQGNEVTTEDSTSSQISNKDIEANPDDFGVFSSRFVGVLGNILVNDLLDGRAADPDLVDFELIETDGLIGLVS